jgi:hypothetical protein
MMYPATDNPASSENRALIRFLRAKIISATEIHSELWAIYGQKVMSEGTVRQWCRMLKGGQNIFTMKGVVVGHL